jgi:hypothetical protein
MERVTAIQAIFLGGPATIDAGHEPQFPKGTGDNDEQKAAGEPIQPTNKKGREAQRKATKGPAQNQAVES